MMDTGGFVPPRDERKIAFEKRGCHESPARTSFEGGGLAPPRRRQLLLVEGHLGLRWQIPPWREATALSRPQPPTERKWFTAVQDTLQSRSSQTQSTLVKPLPCGMAEARPILSVCQGASAQEKFALRAPEPTSDVTSPSPPSRGRGRRAPIHS